MNCQHIKVSTAEISVQKGGVEPPTAASCDQDIAVAIQVAADGRGHSTLPSGTDSTKLALILKCKYSKEIQRRRSAYVIHGFVLGLERENVLAGLTPWLAIVRIYMCHNMSNSILEVIDGVAIGVEQTSSIPLPVEIIVRLQCVERVDRDEQFNAIFVRIEHHIIQASQYLVIPLSRI